MVRPETKPDDVHGMLAAHGVLTSRGGRTSHAALVARQFGKPAVVGVVALEVDLGRADASPSARACCKEGDWLSIDGTTGEVFAGQLDDRGARRSTIRRCSSCSAGPTASARSACGRTPTIRATRERARRFGAEGIGLARTEHMFFETERLPIVQAMILAQDDAERDEHLAKLLPMQREDFAGLFQAMDGLPVTIRLIDPPLHEFLPSHDELLETSSSSRRARMRVRNWRRGRTRWAWAARSSRSGGCSTAVEAHARAEPDAGPARRAPGHPHAGAGAHAGARDLRGGVQLRDARA